MGEDGGGGDVRLRMWCGGLHKEVTREEVVRAMERFGDVADVRVRSSSRDTFCFVQFTSQRALETAIDKMNGASSTIGERLKCAPATEDKKPSGGGGGGRGSSPAHYRQDSRSRTPPRRSSHREPQRRRPEDARRRDSRAPSRSRRRPRSRSRQQEPSERGSGGPRGAGTVPKGRYKITVERLPDDMTWLELKDMGREFGPSLTFARTYRQRGACCGMLEFKERTDAERVVRELDHRRVQGSRERLVAYMGDGGA